MSGDETTIQTYDQIATSFAERYWDVVLERALDGFATRHPTPAATTVPFPPHPNTVCNAPRLMRSIR